MKLEDLARRSIHPKLGTPGFECPCIEAMNLIPILDLVQFENIELIGADDGDPGFAMVPNTLKIPYRLKIYLSKQTTDCLLVIDEHTHLFGQIRLFGSGHTIVAVGPNKSSFACDIRLNGAGGFVYLGRGGTSNGLTIDLFGDRVNALVGEGVLVAHDVVVYTADMHGIMDCATGAWLNPPADVVIEPRVWLGRRSTVLKGSRIGFGSIIGTGAVVTGTIERRSVAVGAPAKVVKRGVTWISGSQPRKTDLAEFRDMENRLGLSEEH